MLLLDAKTDGSVRRCGITVKKLIAAAKEKGVTSIALADFQNFASLLPFEGKCEDEGLKAIVGIDLNDAVLYAKNNAGKHELFKLVSKAGECSEDALLDFSDDLMKETITSGNVVLTTGYMNGKICRLLSQATADSKRLSDLKSEMDKLCSPEEAATGKNRMSYDKASGKLQDLKEQIAELKKVAKMSTLSLEKKIDKAIADGNDAKAAELKKELDEKQTAAKEASMKIPGLEKSLSVLNAAKTKIAKFSKNSEAEAKKWETLHEEYQKIDARLKARNERQEAIHQLDKWIDIFGKENVLVTLFCHGSAEEKKILPQLVSIAEEMGLKTCVGNNPQMCSGSKDDIQLREMLMALNRPGTEYVHLNPAQKREFILSDEELKNAIPADPAVIDAALEGNRWIEENCTVQKENENHYPKFTPPNGMTSDEYLMHMIKRGIEQKFPAGLPEEYQERLDHEYHVITSMGYSDYHLIVQDFLRYARAAGKLDLSTEEEIARSYDIDLIEKRVEGRVGKPVGVGRGSAAGSLICDLLGITSLDPIALKLFFERFLNPERVSMPDIDCDIETNIRPYAIDYVRHKYGKDSVAAIFTRGKLSGKAALRTAARVLGSRDAEDTNIYLDLEGKIADMGMGLSESDVDLKLADVVEDKTQTDDIGTQYVVNGLFTIYKDDPKAIEIIKAGLLLEGVSDHFGKHAAGIIVTDGNPVSDYIPLIRDSNGAMMTQCDMVESEKIGLLKIDFLGLNNLTIITDTVRKVEETTGKKVNVDNLPYEAEVFANIFSTGRTNSVFQFESKGMKSMLKDFQPDNIEDIILLVAAYRPGPMQYLPQVIANKRSGKIESSGIPELDKILENTYGATIYQEQVQEIFKVLAGYSLGQADLVRRAMSKKKVDVLKAERESFVHGDEKRGIAGCVANGISEEQANEIFNQMEEFSRYAFNKAHAACYAETSYITAWLKYHYPAEYIASVLDNTVFDKIAGLIDDMQDAGIKCLQPDINYSDTCFSVDKTTGNVRYGLSSIKGITKAVEPIVEERKRNGKYTSVQDFVKRCLPGKSLIEKLASAGALDSLEPSRTAVINACEELGKHKDDLKKDLKDLSVCAEERRQRYLEKKELHETAIMETRIDPVPEDRFALLKKERELLGTFLSAQPLDLYPDVSEQKGISMISDLEEPDRYVTVYGMVVDLKVFLTKKSAEEMASFRIMGNDGSVAAVAFPKKYSGIKKTLEEGKVYRFRCKTMMDREQIKLSVEETETVAVKREPVIVLAEDPAAIYDKGKIFERFKSANGDPLILTIPGFTCEEDALCKPDFGVDREAVKSYCSRSDVFSYADR